MALCLTESLVEKGFDPVDQKKKAAMVSNLMKCSGFTIARFEDYPKSEVPTRLRRLLLFIPSPLTAVV